MKFFCIVPWVHSGIQRYLAGKTYDLNQDQVNLFASMKNSRRDDDDIGAMKRFQPSDLEAKACLEKLIAKAQEPAYVKADAKASRDPEESKKAKEPDLGGAPPAPKRADLMKEASSLGIKEANKMKVPELIEAIAKALTKQGAGTQ